MGIVQVTAPVKKKRKKKILQATVPANQARKKRPKNLQRKKKVVLHLIVPVKAQKIRKWIQNKIVLHLTAPVKNLVLRRKKMPRKKMIVLHLIVQVTAPVKKKKKKILQATVPANQ